MQATTQTEKMSVRIPIPEYPKSNNNKYSIFIIYADKLLFNNFIRKTYRIREYTHLDHLFWSNIKWLEIDIK